MAKDKKVFLFDPPRAGFRLAVLARSLTDARKYVRADGSRQHRALKFTAAVEPGATVAPGYCGAVVRYRDEMSPYEISRRAGSPGFEDVIA